MRLPKLRWRTKTTVLLEEIDFLRAQVAQLQNYVLMTGPAPITAQTQTSPPFPRWNDGEPEEPGQRAYSTELEEDVEFMATEGIIDEAQAARILKEAGIDLEEVDLTID
jgi:hypothetical protein